MAWQEAQASQGEGREGARFRTVEYKSMPNIKWYITMHKLKSKKQTVLQFIPSCTSQQSWSNPQNLFAGHESKIFDSNLSFDQYNHVKKSPNLPVASDS